jgi:hypothetical protein
MSSSDTPSLGPGVQVACIFSTALSAWPKVSAMIAMPEL